MSVQPLVSIGVPAFNEAEFFEESVRNILKQTYPNLEILVADNGSDDGTSEICAKLAAEDTRITHIRHPRNIGQNANFNYLPRAATGTYFCWTSAHDLLEPDFVEKCVAALEADAGAVLAYPKTLYMTKEGRVDGEKPQNPFDIRTMKPAKRFREVMWRVDCNVVYGMWRLRPMLDSNLFQLVPAPDRVFLAEMAIKGTFVPADTAKYYRANRGSVPQTELQKRHRLMSYLKPHRPYSDEELSGNAFYAPTYRAFRRTVLDARFSIFTRWRLLLSVWLSGVVKAHLFPGADAASAVVKAILPKPLLKRILQRIQ